MVATSQLQSVSPIGATDPLNLPVADVTQAATFYTDVLGFQLVDTHDGPPRSITVRRDDVTLGLAENGGDPEQASCYINISDVAPLQTEYQGKGVNVSDVKEMEYDGRQYEVFWVKDPGGICYCLGRPVD